jgi:hypothetical protein
MRFARRVRSPLGTHHFAIKHPVSRAPLNGAFEDERTLPDTSYDVNSTKQTRGLRRALVQAVLHAKRGSIVTMSVLGR